MVDVTPLIDPETKSPVGGDAAHGEELFASCAACHGEDGLTLNFGSEDEPEFVGTIALDNPWSSCIKFAPANRVHPCQLRWTEGGAWTIW